MGGNMVARSMCLGRTANIIYFLSGNNGCFQGPCIAGQQLISAAS